MGATRREPRFQSQPGYSPLAAVCLAVAVGACVPESDCSEFLSSRSWLVLGVGFGLVWMICRGARGSVLALLCGVVCCSAAYASQSWGRYEPDRLAYWLEEDATPICVRGSVHEAPALPPDPRGGVWRFVMRAEAVRHGRHWRPCRGLGRLQVPIVPSDSAPNDSSGSDGQSSLMQLAPGDRILVWGEAQRPRTPSNPGEFDFARYCRVRKLDYLLQTKCSAQVYPESRGVRASWRRVVHHARRQAALTLARRLEASQVGVAAALVLGDRSGLSRDQRDRFLRTGVMHLLAISGLHVGMLVTLVWAAERVGWLTQRFSVPIAVIVAAAFALFTSAQPPVVRAALFVATLGVARCAGRDSKALGLLATTGIIVLLINPAYIGEPGVQLSFLAVAALLCYGEAFVRKPSISPISRLIDEARPWLDRLIRRSVRRTWELLCASGAISMITAPLTSRVFHVVAPLAAMLNLVLAPLAAVVLIFGLLTVVLDATLGLGFLTSPFCSCAIAAMEGILREVETSRLGFHWVGGPPRWWVAGFYLILALVTWIPLKPRGRLAVLLLSLWFASYAIPAAFLAAPRSELRCTILDVGHGACVLIQTPSGVNIVYDAGCLGSGLRAGRVASQAFWSQGVGVVDAVVLSHADADHYNAAPMLASRFRVSELITSRAFRQDASGAAAAAALTRRGARWRFAPSRQFREWRTRDGVSLIFLQPLSGAVGDDNAGSLLLLVQYRGRRILLTGDLEGEGMRRLLRQSPLRVDVALAPHHGSRHSQPDEFLDWTRAGNMVVSCGRSAALDSLISACDKRETGIWTTPRDGAIQVSIDEHGRLAMQSWKRRPWATR